VGKQTGTTNLEKTHIGHFHNNNIGICQQYLISLWSRSEVTYRHDTL